MIVPLVVRALQKHRRGLQGVQQCRVMTRCLHEPGLNRTVLGEGGLDDWLIRKVIEANLSAFEEQYDAFLHAAALVEHNHHRDGSLCFVDGEYGLLCVAVENVKRICAPRNDRPFRSSTDTLMRTSSDDAVSTAGGSGALAECRLTVPPSNA